MREHKDVFVKISLLQLKYYAGGFAWKLRITSAAGTRSMGRLRLLSVHQISSKMMESKRERDNQRQDTNRHWIFFSLYL